MPPFTATSTFNLRGVYGQIKPVDLGAKAYIETPEPFQSSLAMNRLLGEVNRAALRDTMMWHWRGTFRREHFKQTSRTKYRHYERNPVYKSFKRRRWGSITDHVSGRRERRITSREAMTQRQPRVAAKQIRGSGVFKATAQLAPWPFKEKGGRPANEVTTEKMSDELARWTDKDLAAAGEFFRERFIFHFDDKISKRKKLKKRYAGFRQSL